MESTDATAPVVAPRRRRSAAQWAELIDRQQRSGLTIRAFCAAESLCENSFFRWRRRVGQSQPASPPPSGPFVRLHPPTPDPAPGTPGTAGIPGPPATHPVVARFPGGIEVAVAPGLLADLVAALRQPAPARGAASC